MPDANTFLPPQIVLPKALRITAISQSYPMVVRVEDISTYVVGQQIHLSIPPGYGMEGANQMTGVIVEINGLNITTNLNSLAFTPFVVRDPVSTASLTSAGSINLYNIQQVPFRAGTQQGN